ncbi:MAG: flagellar basal body P-ring formation protein FlgA, partial [Alphaproteobacteria bacterium]|nr:flagellar basal body P-ring formation protein FlgA [Alphaproteobacteria bacterium]
MIRIVLALLMTGVLGGEALSEPGSGAPRLKELVAVSSEIVRIGDLVDNAGMAADVPVFRAPDLGQTGAV